MEGRGRSIQSMSKGFPGDTFHVSIGLQNFIFLAMDQVALYRKYRPNNFDNLVGQDHVKTTLMNALKTSHVAHAYLFSGPRGTGKTSAARLLAKALNCTDLIDGFEPCEKCDFCVDIVEGKFIDLIEIDAASNRGIDEVRDLNEKIRFAPSRGDHKIYIIDEVHMMTKEAFNALLKTLEEPPSHAFFVLATTEIHKIPETIISRCQRFDFKRITEKTIVERLKYIAQKEGVKAEEKALEAISRYVNGGMRDAVGLFEQLTVGKEVKFDHIRDILGISDHNLLENFYQALAGNNPRKAIKIVHTLHDQGSELKQFLHEFIDSLRQKLLENIEKNEKAPLGRIIEMIEVFQETEQRLFSASIPQLPFEVAIIRIAGNMQKAEVIKKVVREVEEVEAVQKVEEVAPVEPMKAVAAEVTEEAPVKEVEVSPSGEKSPRGEVVELSLDLLREKWPRITERIKSPSLRMSLKGAQPAKIEGPNLTLQFNTNFHKDKTMEHDNRVHLESVIKELFGNGVKVSAVVKAIEIKPVMEEDKVEAQPEESVSAGDVDAALEIFGGMVMED